MDPHSRQSRTASSAALPELRETISVKTDASCQSILACIKGPSMIIVTSDIPQVLLNVDVLL